MQASNQPKDLEKGFRVHYVNIEDNIIKKEQLIPENNSGLEDRERFFSLLKAKWDEIPRYSNAERAGITGKDLRTYVGDLSETYPNTGIALIVGFYKGQYFTSTGFLINKKFLLTAGHAVKDKIFAEELFILIGAEKDQLPFGVRRPSDVYIFRRDSDIYLNPKQDPQFDLALIKLDSEVDTNDFLMLQKLDKVLIEKLCGASDISEIHARITGYDIIRITRDNKLAFCLMTHEERLTLLNKRGLFYLIETEKGQSGSPVMVTIKGKIYAIAVHNASYKDDKNPNGGAALTEKIISTIQNIVKLHSESDDEQSMYLDSSSLDNTINKTLDSSHLTENFEDRSIGMKLYDQERYDDAINFFETSIKNAINLNGEENHPLIAALYHNLGLVYQDKEQWTKSIHYYSKSLEINFSYFGGENNFAIADTYHNLGLLYCDQQNFEESLTNYQKSIRIKKTLKAENNSNGFDNFFTSTNYENVIKQSVDSFDNSLKVYAGEKLHSSIADTFNNLGSLQKAQMKYDEALTIYHESLQMNKANEKKNHVLSGVICHNIGSVYDTQGNYEQALELYRLSFGLKTKLYGRGSYSSFATLYNNIGKVYYNQGKYEKALEFYHKSLDINIKLYGVDNHSSIATTYLIIGSVYRDQGKYEQALESFNKSLSIAMKVYGGENHSSVANAYNEIGSVYYAQEKYEQALEFYQKSLDIKIKLYGGENHSSVADTYKNIGSVYGDQEEYKKELEFYQKFLDISFKLYGEDYHSSIATKYHSTDLSKAKHLFDCGFLQQEQFRNFNYNSLNSLPSGVRTYLTQGKFPNGHSILDGEHVLHADSKYIITAKITVSHQTSFLSGNTLRVVRFFIKNYTTYVMS